MTKIRLSALYMYLDYKEQLLHFESYDKNTGAMFLRHGYKHRALTS